MRSKLTPILANCAVLLALIGISGTVTQASDIQGAETIVSGSVEIILSNVDTAIDVREINDTEQVDASRINAVNRRIDMGVASPIELAEAIQIDSGAPVDNDTPATIRS